MAASDHDRVFVDTNVLVYALIRNDARSVPAENILLQRPRLSVQVLNECVDVLRRKVRWDWDRIEAALASIEQLCGPPLPLNRATHRLSVDIAKSHALRIYDALIVAAALEAGCTVIYSEDMHSGHRIESVTILNPFAAN